MGASSQYCVDMLRDQDPALYASLLFLKEEQRPVTAVLQAFHLEIGRISFIVREPMAGEVRLQWWRDVINGERAGEAESNPLASALLEVISKHQLSQEGFIRYLDARVFDLYNDPMPDRETLEAYFGETESFVFHMCGIANGLTQNSDFANACGHSGVAMGLERAIARMAYDRNRQRCFVPNTDLEKAGLGVELWFSDTTIKHETVMSEYLSFAKSHLDKAVMAIRQLPKSDRISFLPLVFSRQKMEAFEKANSKLLLTDFMVPPSPLRSQMALWKTVFFGF